MTRKNPATLIFGAFLFVVLMVLQASVLASEGVTPNELIEGNDAVPEEQDSDSVDGMENAVMKNMRLKSSKYVRKF